MPDLNSGELTLLAIALVAATVNGGLGYGFSSITVPVALLFFSNRALNPALVAVEVGINLLALWVNRRALGGVWRRILPMLIGAVPGIALGSYALASVDNGWLKLFTYVVLLPLILLQLAGVRRPLRNERAVGGPLGFGVGLLYSATTISGPPLALLFNNQGLTKDEFRASLSLFRIVESSFTAVAYLLLGLYRPDTARIAGLLGPGILIGIPLGYTLLRRLEPETFRRLCMSADAVLVSFGLTQVAISRFKISPGIAYAIAGVGWVLGAPLFWSYLRIRKEALAAAARQALSGSPRASSVESAT